MGEDKAAGGRGEAPMQFVGRVEYLSPGLIDFLVGAGIAPDVSAGRVRGTLVLGRIAPPAETARMEEAVAKLQVGGAPITAEDLVAFCDHYSDED